MLLKLHLPVRHYKNMMPRKTQETILIISAVIFAVIWFCLNLNLPPPYRGLVCCDSLNYIELSKHPIDHLIRYIGDRTFGYPLFLGVIRQLVLHFGYEVAAINAALITQLVIHFFATFFLFSSIVKTGIQLPIWSRIAVIANTGLCSYAALPLTDSIATSLYMISGGAIIRFLNGGGRKWLSFAGLLFGYVALVRPSFLPVIIVVILATLIYNLFINSILHSIKSGIWIIFFTSILVGYNFYLGYQKFGHATFQNPNFYARSSIGSALAGLRGGRVFAVMQPNQDWVEKEIEDPYSVKYIFDACDHNMSSASELLLKCYIKRSIYVPGHLLKKQIGIFDNFHLNGYAVVVTEYWQLLIGRFFGALAFSGYILSGILLLYIFIKLIKKESRKSANKLNAVFITSLFSFVYIFISSNSHIESRYGFPAVAFSILSLGLSKNMAIKNKNTYLYYIITVALSCALFFGQVFYWDSLSMTNFRY